MNTSLNHALEKEVRHSKGVLLEELKTTMKTLEAAETTVTLSEVTCQVDRSTLEIESSNSIQT